MAKIDTQIMTKTAESKETYGQTRGINSSQKQFTCFYKMFSVSNTFLGLTLWNW